MRTRFVVALAAMLAFAVAPARAGEVHVAVAANFVKPLRAIAEAFQQETGDTAVVSEGSTGKLYAQIANGAPFEVFLSADAERPRRLLAEGHAVAGTDFAYALGRLALWSRDAARVQGPEVEYVVGLPGDGVETEVFFSDLGHEYIRINAEYTT